MKIIEETPGLEDSKINLHKEEKRSPSAKEETATYIMLNDRVNETKESLRK